MFCRGDRTSSCDCFDCSQLDAGTHADLSLIQPEDGREIKIDQIREVISTCSSYPSMAPVRAIVLDGADVLNTAGANALLKTLEEHHSTVRFFLLSQRERRVLPTIRSRCGIIRFRPLPESFILASILASPAVPTLEDGAVNRLKSHVYARMGEGSVGRAISYLGSGKIGLRDKAFLLLQSGIRRDLPSIFSILSSFEKELTLGIRFLVQILFDLFVVGHASDRVIHMDLLESLRQLHVQAPMPVLYKLSVGARELLDSGSTSNINLPFHVQHLFVQTFFGS